MTGWAPRDVIILIFAVAVVIALELAVVSALMEGDLTDHALNAISVILGVMLGLVAAHLKVRWRSGRLEEGNGG